MDSNETSAAKKRHCVVLILHLCLHVFDRVTWLHMQVDGISVRSAQQFAFHHKDEGPNAESILLSDIVIRTGLSILELLSRKDQALLVCIWLPSRIEIRKGVSILERVCQSPSCFPLKIRLYWIKRSGLWKAMKLHCGLLKREEASL